MELSPSLISHQASVDVKQYSLLADTELITWDQSKLVSFATLWATVSIKCVMLAAGLHVSRKRR